MNISELAQALGLEVDEYRELFDLFVETGRSDLAMLESAIKQGSAEKIAATAHSLKGASGNLGFMELHGMANEIVQEARSNRLEGILESFNAMKKAFETVVQEVNSV